MRVRGPCIIFIVCSLWLSGCQTVPTDLKKQPEWFAQALGEYKSIIESGDRDLLGATSFSMNEEGVLTGRYEMRESDATVSGELYDCVSLGVGSLSCTWKDKYGDGILQLQFSADFLRFEGRWSIPGKARQYSWSGVK